MSKRTAFQELLLFLFDGYPESKVSENELKELFKDQQAINSLISKGFLVELKASDESLKEKYYSLGLHAIELILVWKTEELAKNTTRLTILILVLGSAMLVFLVLSFIMQLVQFILK